jgi:hypothetical protein
MATQDEMMKLFKPPRQKPLSEGEKETLRERGAFHPCKRHGCVDGWIHVPGKNPIGQVRRCQCFKGWAAEQM